MKIINRKLNRFEKIATIVVTIEITLLLIMFSLIVLIPFGNFIIEAIKYTYL